MCKFLVGGRTPPPHPPPLVGKTLYKFCQQVFIYNEEAPCTSYTSCAKVAIFLLQDFSTFRVTDIYGTQGFQLRPTNSNFC